MGGATEGRMVEGAMVEEVGGRDLIAKQETARSRSLGEDAKQHQENDQITAETEGLKYTETN